MVRLRTFAEPLTELSLWNLIQYKERDFKMSTINQLIEKYGLDGVAPTSESAPAINRSPQTMRKWSCLDNGPIRPIRINKILAWRVSELQALINGEV